MKRKIIIASLVLVALVAAAWAFVGSNSSSPQDRSPTDEPQQSNQTPPEGSDNTIRLIATGDMIPHDTINLRAEDNSLQPYVGYFEHLQPLFNSADLVFCNQEAPSAGEAYGIAGYPSFNAPESFARGLSTVGCNIISLGNNHAADRGVEAIGVTRDVWQSLNPYAVGGANSSSAQQADPAFFEYQGVRFAFVSFAEFSNNTAIPSYAVNIFSDSLVEQLMAKARESADYIIVSAHWGVEDQEALSAAQERWAGKLAGEGADLIIGSGPHVLQTVKQLPKAGGGQTLVYYSLGNLLSSQLTLEQRVGAIAVIDFEVDSQDLLISRIAALPTYMHYEWTADEAAREDLLARHSVKLYPLANSAEPLSRSLLGSSVEAQLSRVSSLLNQFIEVKILRPGDF